MGKPPCMLQLEQRPSYGKYVKVTGFQEPEYPILPVGFTKFPGPVKFCSG